MLDQIIGSEDVAKLHEEIGSTHLAAIHRLTGDQAVRVLIAVRGLAPGVYADALAQAGLQAAETDSRHRPNISRYCSGGGPWPCHEAQEEVADSPVSGGPVAPLNETGGSR